ncbi:MAG: hypothetical protein KF755_12805 [Burkholderiaceae bacterium]|nr:hypothetical protein [Burkholderiaceae bacterium]
MTQVKPDSARHGKLALTMGVRTLLLVAATQLFLGCTTPTQVPPNPAVGPRAPFGHIEVHAANVPPQTNFAQVLQTKGQAAATGAATGALIGVGELAHGLASCGGAYCGAAFMVLLPVFVATGAIANAVVHAAGAESRQIVEDGERAMQRGLERLQLQSELARRLGASLASRGEPQGSPARIDIEVRRVEVRESAAPGAKVSRYALAIAVHARLVAGEKVVDELTYAYRSRSAPARDWLADEARLFVDEMEQGLTRTAEVLAEELLLLYYPPPADDDKSLVPYYALKPHYPEPVRSIDIRGAWFERYRQSWGGLEFVPVDSLAPVFRWESFPRALDVAAAGGAAGRFTDVSYEFALFEAQRIGVIYETGKPLYRFVGLGDPSLRLESLEPCSRYLWTVRARFRLDGQPRVTEWTGAYNAFADQQPWEQRRGLQTTSMMRWGFPAERFYLPFRTPGDCQS